MDWKEVGQWVKHNAAPGAALVGSLVSGNAPGAIAAGVAMLSSATGTNDPSEALRALQTDPSTVVRLKEIAASEEHSIRAHLADMNRMELEDRQASHAETQKTIRAGDASPDGAIRAVRPAQASISLAAGLYYAVCTEAPDVTILSLLLALPWAYAGLREVGKYNVLKSLTATKSGK